MSNETDAVNNKEIVIEKARAKKKSVLSDACKTKKKGRLRWSQETTTALKNNATPVTGVLSLSLPLPLNVMFWFLLRKCVAGHTVVLLLVTLW